LRCKKSKRTFEASDEEGDYQLPSREDSPKVSSIQRRNLHQEQQVHQGADRIVVSVVEADPGYKNNMRKNVRFLNISRSKKLFDDFPYSQVLDSVSGICSDQKNQMERKRGYGISPQFKQLMKESKIFKLCLLQEVLETQLEIFHRGQSHPDTAEGFVVNGYKSITPFIELEYLDYFKHHAVDIMHFSEICCNLLLEDIIRKELFSFIEEKFCKRIKDLEILVFH